MPIKKAVWRNKTTTDALVRYNYCKVHPWEVAAPIDFCASKSLCTHLDDITQPSIFTTAAHFTMIGMGCPHPSIHNSYSIATHIHLWSASTLSGGFVLSLCTVTNSLSLAEAHSLIVLLRAKDALWFNLMKTARVVGNLLATPHEAD